MFVSISCTSCLVWTEERAARRRAHGQSDAEGVLLHTVKWLWMRAPGTTRRRKTTRSSPSAKLEHHVIAWRDSRHAAPSSVHRRKARSEYGAGIERHGEAAETRGAGSHGGRRTSVCSHGCNEDAGTDCAATDARMHTHRFTTEAAQSKAQRIETTPYCAYKTELINPSKAGEQTPHLIVHT